MKTHPQEAQHGKKPDILPGPIFRYGKRVISIASTIGVMVSSACVTSNSNKKDKSVNGEQPISNSPLSERAPRPKLLQHLKPKSPSVRQIPAIPSTMRRVNREMKGKRPPMRGGADYECLTNVGGKQGSRAESLTNLTCD